jgi:hypothetical protein
MRTTVKLLAVAAGVSLAATLCAAQSQASAHIPSVAHAFTPPLSSLSTAEQNWQRGAHRRIMLKPMKPGNGGRPGGGSGGGSWTTDPVVQSGGPGQSYNIDGMFEGQGTGGAIPPDPNLAVGLNTTGDTQTTQIVQVVNTSVDVYMTDGTPQLASSVDLGLLFSYLPNTNCSASPDGGDVIVLWDQLDQRWLLSQLAYNSTFTQNDLCLAISQSSDATQNYYLYDIPFGSSLPDYPKLAVWGDGIYFSANMFKMSINRHTGAASSTFIGAQACSFPLSEVSSPPKNFSMNCSGSGNTAIYNILPASLDGTYPSPSVPPSGSDYYLQFVDNLSTTSGNELALYQFQSGQLKLVSDLPVAEFHEGCGGGTCIPQAGTSQQLDSVGDRLMYRLSYRSYSDGTQAMVVNHSVQVSSSSNQTGIRWYQLCATSSGGSFSVCHQGTFSPDNSTYRWMGSIAQDSAGDLGLGYSTSSGLEFPSIAVTGMQPGESGIEQEDVVFPGPNFQDTYSRWGDYSSMALDPNDCTFWYTTEYSTPLNVLGVWNFFWGTKIVSFSFSGCTPH